MLFDFRVNQIIRFFQHLQKCKINLRAISNQSGQLAHGKVVCGKVKKRQTAMVVSFSSVEIENELEREFEKSWKMTV